MPRQKTCRNCGASFTGDTCSVFCRVCRFVDKTCPICGKQFTTRRGWKVTTCSRQCGATLRWAAIVASRGSRRPPCAWCGQPITRKCMHYGKHKAEHVFCSTACMGKWQSANRRGPNHPGWKGGYKGLTRYGPNWGMQRRNARSRDGYKCTCCGRSEAELGRQLQVHHLIPFTRFGHDRYREANQLPNLISLCVECHTTIGHQNGQIHGF